MRSVLIIIMLVPPALILLAMVLLYAQLKQFQSAVPVIQNQEHLLKFKRMAAFQMRVSSILLIVWLPPLAWIYGIAIARELGWLDLLLFVLLPVVAIFATASQMIGLARAVRATPASDATLEAERNRVADVWVHGKSPDW